MTDDVNAEIDALYDLPPAEFTAARDALVKRLRAEKRRDDANTVKALRRPTAAAWAVNQVARRHPAALEAVLDAGARLATAQRRVLSGIKDAGLQAAAAQRRDAIEQAWRLAAAALEAQGAGAPAQRQAVVETLEAASVDEPAATEVRAGRLTKELVPPSDFGAVSGFALVPSSPADTAEGDRNDDAPEQDTAAARRDAEQAAAAARKEADAAQRAAGDARQAAVRATAEAQRLAVQAEQAAQAAAAAETKARQQDRAATELEQAAAAAAGEADRLVARAAAPAGG